jgi:serine protease
MTRRVRLALGTLGALALGLAVPAGALGVAPTAANTSVAHRIVPGPVRVLGPVHGRAAHPGAGLVASTTNLQYGGGVAGHGVITRPAVYLVFWGSQWDPKDPYAAYEQRFFRGLYGAGDDWTSVQRQYCEGVKKDATTCRVKPGTRAPHIIGRPAAGGVVKGVWFDDESLAVPTDIWFQYGDRGLADNVAAEAARAAAHFGNTKVGSNANAVYIVNEPSHFDSPGYGFYCGYHGTVSSPYGTIVYADLPYLTDVENPTHTPVSCGQNMVNKGAAGTYDGVSIVGGHEFIETLTDPYPGYGWLDAAGNETADKCQWLTSGPGAMADLHLATGTFAVQSTWSNKAANGNGGCVVHGGRG